VCGHPAFLIAAKIHVRRRRQRASAAPAREKAAAKGGGPAESVAGSPAALVRFIPPGLIDLLEDPEAWILRHLPGGKGGMLVSLFAILGGLSVGLGAVLFALVRLWATAAPGLTDEEHSSVLGTDEILEPDDILGDPWPGAADPELSKYPKPSNE
jgi:hypothetical protein